MGLTVDLSAIKKQISFFYDCSFPLTSGRHRTYVARNDSVNCYKQKRDWPISLFYYTYIDRLFTQILVSVHWWPHLPPHRSWGGHVVFGGLSCKMMKRCEDVAWLLEDRRAHVLASCVPVSPEWWPVLSDLLQASAWTDSAIQGRPQSPFRLVCRVWSCVSPRWDKKVSIVINAEEAKRAADTHLKVWARMKRKSIVEHSVQTNPQAPHIHLRSYVQWFVL